MELLSFSQVILGVETLTRALGVRVLHSDTLVYSTVFLFLGYITWLSNREITTSLRNSRKSERNLELERNTLERRIAERTIELERMKKLEHAAKYGEISRGLLHDLMSPLSSISLYLEQLKNTPDHSRESLSSLQRMLDISRRLNSFSENLKLFLGNENGVHPNKTTDVVKELEIMRDILSYKARTSGVKLVFNMPQSLIVPVDHVRMHQVISNLMTNALESYESPCMKDRNEGLVTVTVTQAIQSFTISVTDTGCGITAEDALRIFKKPFTTKKHGSGNGLMTIRTIVEDEFRGKIIMQSTPGSGTSFIVTIPLQTTSPLPQI